MGLSNELIAQFAKLTKTERNTKTESTHNGTIKIVDNAKYVKLDGSDQLTPISTTADIHDGDRVTVMIKNHSATVTGNITSPSARTNDLQETAGKVDGWDSRITDVEILVADKVSTTEFDAQTGRIDNLVSDNVVIKDTLTANTAIVEEIKAENVVISERLDATEAYIENLETNFLTVEIADIRYASIEELEAIDADVYNLNATYATFETTTTNRLSAIDATISDLDATYATIDDLVVERARIDVIEAGQLGADSALIKQLQSDVANIDTLIFGSASGDVIQSSFSNAVIAQLGNAQIKSAMIESVSANKITAGDIITNNVRVMSEDGKLLISDETIQISDNSRVRVQIGKDAAGDYSINIWDEAGNLMFSEGGITDSAIKQAIIRDNMISDTANISAYKLNINSLFEVINGSTNTIKATRIYLDDESQTLNVAFTSLSSDVNSLENTVTSQGTELSIIQGQIASKVWQEDIDTSSDFMSTKYSSLEQTVDSMNVVIASHTNQVETLSDKMTSVETNLNGFKTTVSDTYATKVDISSLQLTADGLTSRVINNEKDIETALTNASKAQADISKLEIGGRNYIRNGKGDVKDGFFKYFDTVDGGYGEHTITSQKTYANLSIGSGFIIGCREYEVGAQVTMSYDFMYTAWNFPEGTDRTEFWIGQRYSNQSISGGDTTGQWKKVTQHNLPVVGVDCELNEWIHVEKVFTIPTPAAEGIGTAASIQIYNSNADIPASITFRIKNVKLEYGNTATDWTPAPEDMATAKDNELSQSIAEEALSTATTAETLIRQLSDNISMLVTDGNGTSLMQQTESGWTFSTSEMQASISKTAEDLDALNAELGDTANTVDVLKQAVNDLGEIADYVKIRTYENEPCIELGEGDSDFKLLITNTRILFMEGSSVVAHITNQSLFIKKAVIQEELQQGEFVWKARANGNLGLIWKGAAS